MRQKLTAIGAALSLTIFETIVILCIFGIFPLMSTARAAALTDGLPPQYLTAPVFPVRMYAGVIYRGGLVAVSNGIAYPAANATDYRVVGVAEETVDNTSTAAGYSATRNIVVRQGIFAFANSYTGSGTNAVYSVQATDVGKTAWVIDDQTICAVSNGFNVCAGTIAYVPPDKKFIWIDVGKVWASSVTTNSVQR